MSTISSITSLTAHAELQADLSKKVANNADVYANERIVMTPLQIDEMLANGRELASKTTLVESLVNGGSAFFPHTFISQCGVQIAAVIESALDACEKSGKDKILVLGVLHGASSKELGAAKLEELAGRDMCNHYLRDMIPPGDPRLGAEFSLDHFEFLMKESIKRRGLNIEVVMRYPNLVSGDPASLPEIDKFKELAKKSIVIGTGDLCHHGEVFNSKDPLDISEEAYTFARSKIEGSLDLLKSDDYAGYRNYCVGEALSDTKDVGQIMRFLLGPLDYTLHDLLLVDLTSSYGKQGWVAASLIELKSMKA